MAGKDSEERASIINALTFFFNGNSFTYRSLNKKNPGMADRIAILVKQKIGFSMYLFVDHGICIHDIATPVLNEIKKIIIAAGYQVDLDQDDGVELLWPNRIK